MDAKLRFTKKFQELMASGGHLVASLVDGEGQLQVSEIYGGELKDGKDFIVSMFFSEHVAPDFYRALAPQKKASMVVCSPFSMETYQVKGVIEEIAGMNEEDNALSEYWRENYLLCLQNIGVPEGALSNIAYKATHRFGLKVSDIFMQTPQKGTGGAL